jgi:hypothetical protein
MSKTAQGLGGLHHNLQFELSHDRQVSEYSADGILQGKTQVDNFDKFACPNAVRVIIQSLTVGADPSFKRRRNWAADFRLAAKKPLLLAK